MKRIEKIETEEREYGRLLAILAIDDNYPKYVLRTNEFAGGNYKGIKTMHVVDFLLSAELLGNTKPPPLEKDGGGFAKIF